MNTFSLKGNWVDLVIIIFLLYFVIDSFRHNFFIILIEFLSFLFSLLIGFRFYMFFANILISNFSISNTFAKAIGFIIVIFLSETVLASTLLFIIKKVPDKARLAGFLNYFRFIIGFFDGVLFLSFLIPLILAFPVPPVVKQSISTSKLGGFLSEKTAVFEKRYSDIFGGVIDEGLNILTINPESSKSIPIQASQTGLTVGYQDESAMVELVNQERNKVSLNSLSVNEKLTIVARNYAMDMWKRGYFSHYSPEGQDVAGRLTNAGIEFQIVGENLALAPTLLIAHTGLMNSPGHRANILDPQFNQIGIGIVDNGIYGKIFVQIFTN